MSTMYCAVCNAEVEMKDVFVLPTLTQVAPGKVPEQPVACSEDCRDAWFKSEKGMTLEEALEILRKVAQKYAAPVPVELAEAT